MSPTYTFLPSLAAPSPVEPLTMLSYLSAGAFPHIPITPSCCPLVLLNASYCLPHAPNIPPSSP